MFAIQKMIDSRFCRLFAVCILSLCLTVASLGTVASSANPAARTDELVLPLISSVDPAEIIFPKPPPEPIPPPCQEARAMEQTA